MEFKGTQGKWDYKEVLSNDNRLFLSIFEKGKDINEDSISGIWGLSTIDKANALLISKAPEMLEMLKQCLYRVENANHGDFPEKVRKLIEEATKID